MTDTMTNPLVEKIRKLLALASNLNDSVEQAEAAMAKARALAVQHDIDIASVQVFENKKSEEPIVKDSDGISLGKRKSVCQKFISWLLKEHFNVHVIYSQGHDANYNRCQKIVLIGKRSDIDIATYVNNFLNSEFMRLWHSYSKTFNAVTKDRNSYFWGLYNGLSSKLKEAKTQAETDGFVALSSTKTVEEVEQVKACMSLTVTSHKERLEEAVGQFFPRLRSIRSYTSFSHSENARSAGERAGRQISLRRGISSGNQSQIR